MDPPRHGDVPQALLQPCQRVRQKRIKPQEWERHHVEIAALYDEEGKTLAETKAIMVVKYHFQARQVTHSLNTLPYCTKYLNKVTNNID